MRGTEKWKRLLAALAALALVLGMTGCAGSTSAANSNHVRLMVWSPSEDQAKDSGEWLQTCCRRFAEMHPDWDITFVYGVVDEATAAASIAQDADAGADVFMYANDNITVLTDAQAVAKIGGKYAGEVLENCSQAIADSVTMDGYLYGGELRRRPGGQRRGQPLAAAVFTLQCRGGEPLRGAAHRPLGVPGGRGVQFPVAKTACL